MKPLVPYQKRWQYSADFIRLQMQWDEAGYNDDLPEGQSWHYRHPHTNNRKARRRQAARLRAARPKQAR